LCVGNRQVCGGVKDESASAFALIKLYQ